MTQTANPLQQYFRRPALYIRLISNGQWWTPDSLDMPVNQELPVYPMTAIDEITYRTPDALFNGQATVDVIQSCVPAIKDAWKTPIIDLNPILLAMRIASSGHNMNMESKCPECTNVNDYEIDLRTILENQSHPDFNRSVRHGDVEIYFRPMTYHQQNQINTAQFEQQRTIYSVNASDLDNEEKNRQLSEILKKITGMKYKI